MPEAYYSDKLYPFMDRVLALIRQTDAASISSTAGAIRYPQNASK